MSNGLIGKNVVFIRDVRDRAIARSGAWPYRSEARAGERGVIVDENEVHKDVFTVEVEAGEGMGAGLIECVDGDFQIV